MLVAEPDNLRAGRWKLAAWLCATAMLLALLLVLPHLTSSTELVRMRNALLVEPTEPGDFDWTPERPPASFIIERGASDPFFVDLAERLGLAALPSDWDRAVVISRHLLSHPKLDGPPIQADLRETERRIVGRGDGYCGDFTRAFMALAMAAQVPVRAWAFSLDGFGGHGHILPEIWNRQLRRWQLVDVYNNFYFHRKDGVAISAADFRTALAESPRSIFRTPLSAGARPGYPIEEKMWDYYLRGLPQWYMVWGNDVFSYDRAVAQFGVGRFSRSLEQFAGIVSGAYAPVKLLETPENRSAVARLWRLRWTLLLAVVMGLGGFAGMIFCLSKRNKAARRGEVAR